MAFSVGDIVTMKVLSSTLTTARVQAQPPVFGIVDAAADPNYTVLWKDGLLQGSIQPTSLDAIDEPVATEVTRLQGKVVRRRPSGAANSDTSGYDGYVVQLYRRRDTAGTQTATLALVRTVEGFYREIPSADLQAVQGR